MVVLRVVVLQTQNSLNPAGRGSVTRGSGARVSGTNSNILSPAARGSGTRCSGVRDSVTNAKFSKSSREWLW